MRSASSSGNAAPGYASEGARPRLLPVLLLAAGLAGLLLYLPTFHASFAYDDVDYLRDAAEVLSGRAHYWATIFRPQGEHFVPILRILIDASARLFGTSALPLRLLVFLAHIASAVLLGLFAGHLISGRLAPTVTALAYVVPAGFSSMWVWFPSGGCVPIGLVGIVGALVALVSRERIGAFAAYGIAAAGVVFAVLCDNTLVPLIACPALFDYVQRRRRVNRSAAGLFLSFCAAIILATVVISRISYTRSTGNQVHLHLKAAVLRWGFLFFVAPFRFFFPGLGLARPLGPPESGGGILASSAWNGFPWFATLFGAFLFCVLAASLILVFRSEVRALTGSALILAVGPVGMLLLVAVGRWQSSYEELYDADRYFFTLLIPFALMAGSFAVAIRDLLSSQTRRRRVIATLLLLAAGIIEVILHRASLIRRVPWSIYAAHEARFEQLRILGHDLASAADRLPPDSPPLEYPNTAFALDDYHNRRISPSFLLYVANRSGTGRIRIVDPPVSPRDAAILNAVLARWNEQIGAAAPTLSIIDGDLVDQNLEGDIDFRVSPRAADVVDGFYGWEGTSRWMAQAGSLHLRLLGPRLDLLLAAPWPAIQKTFPYWTSLRLQATLSDEGSGNTADLGRVDLTVDGIAPYTLPVPESFFVSERGRQVILTLRSDHVWQPSRVLPGSADGRQLSVDVFRAAFGN